MLQFLKVIRQARNRSKASRRKPSKQRERGFLERVFLMHNLYLDMEKLTMSSVLQRPYQVYSLTSNLFIATLYSLLAVVIYNQEPSFVTLNSSPHSFLSTQVAILTLIVVFALIAILTFSITLAHCLNRSTSQMLRFQSLIQYVQHLPLSYISFYFFLQQTAHRKPSSEDKNIESSTLAFCSLLFGFVGIFNLVLIETMRNTSKLSSRYLLFSFIFRYFLFIGKQISFMLLLSTRNDYSSFTVADHRFDEKKSLAHSSKIVFICSVYVISAYLIYFLWYVCSKKLDARWSLCECVLESYKMLIDYNDAYFTHSTRPTVSLFNLNKLFQLDSIKIALYLVLNYLTELVFAYYWYFCSIMTLGSQIQARINLYNLLNSRSLIINLTELEEIMKLRQFLLVILLGSILISLLSYHIFYQYFYVNKDDKLNKESLLEKARHSTKISHLANYEATHFDSLDSFSIDSYQHSSSISSISPTKLSPQAGLYFNKPPVSKTVSFYSDSIQNMSCTSSFLSSIDSELLPIQHKETTLNSSSSSLYSSDASSVSSIYNNIKAIYEPQNGWKHWKAQQITENEPDSRVQGWLKRVTPQQEPVYELPLGVSSLDSSYISASLVNSVLVNNFTSSLISYSQQPSTDSYLF